MLELYIYDHCPYCVRAQMPLGIKKIPHKLYVLANDDEATPIKLVGQKLVPILTKEDGKHMPESIDIVTHLDKNYGGKPIFTVPKDKENSKKLHLWLNMPRPYLSKLAYPRWVEAPLPEFEEESARRYFTQKKEASIGSFAEHRRNSKALIREAHAHLDMLSSVIISADAVHGTLSMDDILLFPILRSLTIVSELSMPPSVDEYTRRIAELSKIPLHWNFSN